MPAARRRLVLFDEPLLSPDGQIIAVHAIVAHDATIVLALKYPQSVSTCRAGGRFWPPLPTRVHTRYRGNRSGKLPRWPETGASKKYWLQLVEPRLPERGSITQVYCGADATGSDFPLDVGKPKKLA